MSQQTLTAKTHEMIYGPDGQTHSVSELSALISRAYADRSLIIDPAVRQAVASVIGAIEQGTLRAALPGPTPDDTWQPQTWVKEAILLYFSLQGVGPITAGDLRFLDKIPTRHFSVDDQVRVVPPAVCRRGAYVGPGAVLMPSYVNIGAYVGAGTMVDTWATVGSCAQIGDHVHLSGGVGIGGVLEPLQAAPVVIGQGAFIGSRAIIVEGMQVGDRAVIGAGVTLTASTHIIDVTGAEPVEHRGRVPADSIVIPGTYPRTYPAGTYGVPCALIIGRRKPATDLKVSLNEALREFQVAI